AEAVEPARAPARGVFHLASQRRSRRRSSRSQHDGRRIVERLTRSEPERTGTIGPVDLYEQDDEVHLLPRLLPKLRTRSVLDVGAERGGLVAAMLDAGADKVHAVEPEPSNVESMRARFRGDSRVVLHDCAAGSADGRAELHLSSDSSGSALTYAHSLTR